MKKSLLFVCLVFAIALTSVLAGTTGRLAGKVIDAQNSNILQGAEVEFLGTKLTAISNEEGFYLVKNVPPGIYTVQITKSGYESKTVEDVKIAVDRTTQLDIVLSK